MPNWHVISSWIDNDTSYLDEPGITKWEKERDQTALALRDMLEIKECDVFIGFTEEPGALPNTGGRHVEYGYVLGLLSGRNSPCVSKSPKVFIVGPRENVFHHDVGPVTFLQNKEELLEVVDVFNQPNC